MARQQSPRTGLTPWHYVFECFGLTQAEFGRLMGFDRPKVSRALKNAEGVIPDYDKKTILEKAAERGVAIDTDKLIFGVPASVQSDV